MIELKVGDKFVVRSTPLDSCVENKWNERMNGFLGKTLTVYEINRCAESLYYSTMGSVFGWHPNSNHIDWKATKKLREAKKTYEWHEALKMVLEGKIMQSIETCNFIKEINGSVCVYATPTFNHEIILHVSKQLLENKFIEYIEPINLTEDEKTILRNVDGKYKWIARDTDEFLYLFAIRPTKINHWRVDDEGKNMTDLEAFNHLFKQINWEDEEPTLIKELLGNS